MYGIGFYDEYIIRLGNLKDKPDLATPYKIAYLKKLIKNNEVYKFISFQENAEIKLKTLKEGKIWFSFYKILNDETEFQIDYRIKKIVNETGYKQGYIELIINYGLILLLHVEVDKIMTMILSLVLWQMTRFITLFQIIWKV